MLVNMVTITAIMIHSSIVIIHLSIVMTVVVIAVSM